MALVRTRVEAGLDDAAAQADLAARLHRLDVVAGVWTTFRERLVQRCDPWMKNSLHTADELAWACLAPFGEQVDRLPLCVVAHGFGSVVAIEDSAVPAPTPPDSAFRSMWASSTTASAPSAVSASPRGVLKPPALWT